MVIPPGYYAGPLKANREALKNFFVDIAEASPVPVMMYNFPAVSAGIDLDSDLIVDVVKAAPNVCGIKLTCASVGKLTRITAAVDDSEFQALYPRKNEQAPFQIIDGYIDILLPSIASGASGVSPSISRWKTILLTTPGYIGTPQLCARKWCYPPNLLAVFDRRCRNYVCDSGNCVKQTLVLQNIRKRRGCRTL